MEPRADFENLSCSQAINKIITEFPAPGSFFYLLNNGLYLGEYGDYSSCHVACTEGMYMLATANGDYTGDYFFPRGVQGKYQSYAPQMGMCVPKQCSAETVQEYVGPLVQRYAEDWYYENTTV
jgi:hypothetical protein